MSIDTALLQRILEGALLASGKPLTVQQLGDLFAEDERPDNEQIRAVLEDIGNESSGRGFELVQVASGFRFQVIQDIAPWVSRLWEEKPQRYSRALLETLALIAYRQPITRGDIENIRGVSVSSHIIKTLLEREWVRVVGHKDVPGRPAMFATTRKFLDYFNMKSLEQLPSLAEIRDLDSMNEELALEGADTPEIAKLDDSDLSLGAEAEVGLDEAVEVEADEETETETETEVEVEVEVEVESERETVAEPQDKVDAPV